jgi:hypothetical protein
MLRKPKGQITAALLTDFFKSTYSRSTEFPEPELRSVAIANAIKRLLPTRR